jgi:hypothetical protein
MFVMAGNQTDHGVGQPQSGLLFQKIDDLWNYGKPAGWGAVWQDDALDANAISDPFLMTGFDNKTLHLKNKGETEVEISLEVDFLGNEEWSEYKTIKIKAGEYKSYTFPDGYSAHWIRLKVNSASVITAQFVYS